MRQRTIQRPGELVHKVQTAGSTGGLVIPGLDQSPGKFGSVCARWELRLGLNIDNQKTVEYLLLTRCNITEQLIPVKIIFLDS